MRSLVLEGCEVAGGTWGPVQCTGGMPMRPPWWQEKELKRKVGPCYQGRSGHALELGLCSEGDRETGKLR